VPSGFEILDIDRQREVKNLEGPPIVGPSLTKSNDIYIYIYIYIYIEMTTHKKIYSKI
jgi:hypothetical protein